MLSICPCAVARPGMAAPTLRPHGPHRRGSVAARAAETKTEERSSGSQQPIQNLNTEYCDEFVCNSSPAVEASVRQLARDLERANGRWARIFAANVEYRDPHRRFRGPEGYERLDFVPTNVQQAAVKVTTMQMLDNATAQIRWRLTGKLGVLPVDVAGTSEIAMNLLTGRIERHSESWDLSGCSPPAAAAWKAAHAVWAARRASADAGRAVSSTLDSLTSLDEDEQFQQPNPTDPSRFFQQKDTFKQDAIMFMGVLALFYVLTQAWGQLFSGSSGTGGAF